MHPLAYRVLSKRLRQALAELPESSTRACFSEVPAHLLPLLAEMVEARHFDHHGRLFGIGAAHCRDLTETLVGRLKCPSTR